MANNDEDRGLLVSVLAGIGIGVLVGAVAGSCSRRNREKKRGRIWENRWTI